MKYRIHLPRAEGIEGCLGMWLMWSRSLWTWVPSPWKQNVGAVGLKSMAWDQWRLHNSSPGCPYYSISIISISNLCRSCGSCGQGSLSSPPQPELIIPNMNSTWWQHWSPEAESYSIQPQIASKNEGSSFLNKLPLDRNFLIRDPKE